MTKRVYQVGVSLISKISKSQCFTFITTVNVWDEQGLVFRLLPDLIKSIQKYVNQSSPIFSQTMQIETELIKPNHT